MRHGCKSCCMKHLSQAWVLSIEFEQGYDEHKYLIIGHLAEATEELWELDSVLAAEIRQSRLLFMSDHTKIPNFLHFLKEIEANVH